MYWVHLRIDQTARKWPQCTGRFPATNKLYSQLISNIYLYAVLQSCGKPLRIYHWQFFYGNLWIRCILHTNALHVFGISHPGWTQPPFLCLSHNTSILRVVWDGPGSDMKSRGLLVCSAGSPPMLGGLSFQAQMFQRTGLYVIHLTLNHRHLGLISKSFTM